MLLPVQDGAEGEQDSRLWLHFLPTPFQMFRTPGELSEQSLYSLSKGTAVGVGQKEGANLLMIHLSTIARTRDNMLWNLYAEELTV